MWYMIARQDEHEEKSIACLLLNGGCDYGYNGLLGSLRG